LANVTVRSFDDLAREIHSARPRLGDVRLVTVDGPSGSGKTTFARRLLAALSARGSVALVALEELYDGWTLDGAWDCLDRYVLEPVAAGWVGGFYPYDWATESWSPEWPAVPVTAVLVVEGCGSSPLAADAYATHRVWIESSSDIARQRGLARAGRDLDRRLHAWRAMERAHFDLHRTRRRADLRVAGDTEPASGLDPEMFFSVLN